MFLPSRVFFNLRKKKKIAQIVIDVHDAFNDALMQHCHLDPSISPKPSTATYPDKTGKILGGNMEFACAQGFRQTAKIQIGDFVKFGPIADANGLLSNIPWPNSLPVCKRNFCFFFVVFL